MQGSRGLSLSKPEACDKLRLRYLRVIVYLEFPTPNPAPRGGEFFKAGKIGGRSPRFFSPPRGEIPVVTVFERGRARKPSHEKVPRPWDGVRGGGNYVT